MRNNNNMSFLSELARCGDFPSRAARKPTNRKIQPATVNRELACLRAMFNHVIKGDVPLKNPISKTAAKTLRENNEQTRVLNYDSLGDLVHFANPFNPDLYERAKSSALATVSAPLRE